MIHTISLLDKTNKHICHTNDEDLSTIIANTSIQQGIGIVPVDPLAHLHRHQQEHDIEYRRLDYAWGSHG